ncbi:MAG TPA: lipase family protein [Steroidobacteraceae bacterium]|nr:lipase family protein [Steroidobacteraceae bacterium]
MRKPLAYDPSRTALYHPERCDTLFESGQTYSPPQLAVEAARLAYYRAEDSPPERARLVDSLARVGFADLVVFADSKSGAAAFAARRGNDGAALISFRGTQPDDYHDLIADLRANLVEWPESAGRVHQGFALAVRALRPQILEWLASANPDSSHLIMAGHSLGAAMATLAASMWRPGWLVTIGSPRVGDAAFTATVQARHMVRFVDCCDAVTEVPPEVGGYTHIEAKTYLTRNGRIVENPDKSFVTSDRLRARIAYSFEYSWRFCRNVLVRDLADHAPINYARVVFGADTINPD